MFYILIGILIFCFCLTILRQKWFQNQPKIQRNLAIVTYILLVIVIVVAIIC